MNINEVAKLAGVSRATVSRYLNNGYVSDEKKEKIREVIEETGYRPSVSATMLRTKKTRLVGVVIPKINSDAVSRMVAGISKVLSREGFQLLLANTNNDEKEELKYLNLFRDNHVDGVILIGTIFTQKHKKLLRGYKVPVIILGQRLNGYSCVYSDDLNAAYELTERLLRTGTNPAFIGLKAEDEAAGQNRLKGFQKALAFHHIPYREDMIVEADFSVEAGYEKTRLLIKEHPEVDALFCATDNVAAGALACLRDMGIRVPAEVSVTGIGDSAAAKITTPKLTTVHFYYGRSGIEAAELLVDKLSADEDICKEIKMGFEIVEQESTN